MGEEATLGFLKLLSENVVELKFKRRRVKGGFPPHRRMFCTINKALLNSIIGKVTLKFKPPKGIGLPYNPSQRGLVVTWDILMQDYRQIKLESVEIIEVWPIKSKEDVEKFWSFFMDVIYPMSSEEKSNFMKR